MEDAPKLVLGDSRRTGHSVLLVAGGALTVVGLVELAVLWIPFRFGNVAWYFGAVSETASLVPTAGLGAALLTYGIIRHPKAQPKIVRGASIAYASLALIFLLLGALYASAVPVALAEAPGAVVGSLIASMIATGAAVLVYFGACVLIAYHLWHGVKVGQAAAHPSRDRPPKRPARKREAPTRAAARATLDRSTARPAPERVAAGSVVTSHGQRQEAGQTTEQPAEAGVALSTTPSPQRLLVVAPQPFFSDRGTPIATRQLLSALSELGYRVDLLTYPQGRTLDIPGVHEIRISNPLGIREVPIGFSWRKLWLDLFLLPRLIGCMRKNDYACVCGVEEAAFVAALVAPRFGVPVIYDMQSSLPDHLCRVPLFRNAMAKAVIERCESWLLDRVDLTITSAGLAERVAAKSPTAAVREWRYPGIAEQASEGDIHQLRRELSFDGSERVVLYAGTFANYQGLSNLVDAMPEVLRRVPDAVLLLVGAQDGPHDQAIRRMASHLPPENVRILDRQPHESIPSFLALADVVVSPRLYGSNLPIKVLQYMAARRAIVATAIPAHRTVLDPDTSVLVEPTSEALAEGIASLLLDDRRRKELGRNARAFAERHLDWMSFVHSVGVSFGEVAGNGRSD